MRATFPVTVHLFFLRGSQVLLLRRFNTGYADGQYSVPAGHLDGGETVMAAAAREAAEEVGVQIDAAALRFSSVMHRNEGDPQRTGAGERVDFFVRVPAWDGEPVNAEPGKCDELRWSAVDALPENTIPYIRRAIHNDLNDVRFDEFGW